MEHVTDAISGGNRNQTSDGVHGMTPDKQEHDADTAPAIHVQNLTKVYPLYRNSGERLREILDFTGSSRHEKFYALRDVSFQVEAGTAVGIIGVNGSGKSTLLKILSGVLAQSSGSVKTTGRVAALLELGAGFNPEYTGRENVFLNGSLMGIKREQMEERFAQIAEFADIGAFMDQPVKTYSSGMFARLAFAVSIHVDPNILIIDEALSVGDIRFQQKCFRRMTQMKQDRTILLVTHDMGAVIRFCDRVIWLDEGKIRMDGSPEEVVRSYQAYLARMESRQMEEEADRKGLLTPENVECRDVLRLTSGDDIGWDGNDGNQVLEPIPPHLDWYGTGEARIVACGLFDADGRICHLLHGGETVCFAMRVKFQHPVTEGIAGMTVKDRMGTELFSMNSYLIGQNVDELMIQETGISDRYIDKCEYENQSDYIYNCRFEMPHLNEGEYTVSPAFAVGSQSRHSMLCYVHSAYTFRVSVPFEQPLQGVLAVTDFSYEVCHVG